MIEISDPIEAFALWLADARGAGVAEPEAMTVATATPDGSPSARIVLLKRFDSRGFVFFTTSGSRKGRELSANPRAALVIHWASLGRQIRIEGAVETLAAEDSDAYFATRPVQSRLSTWASPQSEVVATREALEDLVEQARARFGDDPPAPPGWVGFLVVPNVIEFWVADPFRLHDRLVFRRCAEGWGRDRLGP
jgi:pyridoxamine 5'-phosphate oxidase